MGSLMEISVKGMMDVYYSFKNFHELSLIYHNKGGINMRKRNVEVLFRMSVEEFDKFKDMVKIAGVTKQKYLFDLVFNSNNQPVHRDEEKALKTITNKMK